MDKLKAAIVATGFFLLSPIKQANNCDIQPAFELPKAVWNVHVDKATKISFFFFLFFFVVSLSLLLASSQALLSVYQHVTYPFHTENNSG